MFRRDFGLSLLVLFALIATALAQELTVVQSNQVPPFTTVNVETTRLVHKLPVINWEKDLTVGRRAMGKSKRPMLLYLTAPSCQYCEMMKQDTFQQQWIIREINKKYTPVMLNGRTHKDIADKLHVRMFPATAVVHPSGKVMDIVQGYKSPAEFVKYLAVAQAKLKVESEQIAKRQNQKDAAPKTVR